MTRGGGSIERESPRAAARKRPIGRRRRRLRMTIGILAAVTVLGGAGGLGYYWSTRPELYRPGEDLSAITRNLTRSLPPGAPEVVLTDVTADSGLGSFRTFAGPRSSQLPEDMGPGAAWGDLDDDGDDDLLLVSGGGALDARDLAACGLYENRGNGTFRRVEDFPETRIIGMAAAWGDYTGDGRLDLVVTGYDSLRLFRNVGGRLVGDDALSDRKGFWAGASWGDFDNDRDLDLYVCGYVRYVAGDADRARATRQYGSAVPYTLNPSSFTPERNLLFVNGGDGTLREAAEEYGVSNPDGRSLGALWHDFDQDGWLDLYVANDVSDNVLYHNRGGTFEEISHAAWVADYRGAMGLAQGDYDRDGDDDMFVTHWVAQENALYDSLLVDLADVEREPGAGTALRFMDVADTKGLGQVALQMVGWGAEFADFDGDGWLDLVVANGSTFETDGEPRRLKPQKSFLFWNRRGEHFHDVAPATDALSGARVTRGLALSDYDGDGDQDILLVHHDDGVQLLRNDMQTGNWLQVRLRSRNPDGSLTGLGDGATVVAHGGDVTQRRSVTSASYLSQSSRTIHFGLGSAPAVDRLTVHWLGGGSDTYRDLGANTRWEIREGEAEARLIGDAASVGSMTDRERITLFWSKQRAAMHAMKVDEDLPAAAALLREALALDPAHEDSLYYLGNCLYALGDEQGATRALEELVRVNPRSHRGLKRLGVLKATPAASPGDLAQGMALLQRALAINPEETGVLLAMGEIGLITGDHDEAEKRLEWAGRTNPRAVSAFFLRGYLAWARGDEVGARELLVRAREARGDEWKPHGTTAEGDVTRRMHTEILPLSPYWGAWDGTPDPAAAFQALDAFLAGGRGTGSP